MDDELLSAGRKYARQRGTTLNDLVRELLSKAAQPDRHAQIEEMFRLMDTHVGSSRGKRWTREELYER